jgi:hypothetical protein
MHLYVVVVYISDVLQRKACAQATELARRLNHARCSTAVADDQVTGLRIIRHADAKHTCRRLHAHDWKPVSQTTAHDLLQCIHAVELTE